MANYKMYPGSKQKDTPGGFNKKQTDTISKLRGPQKIKGKQTFEDVKQRTKPDKLDSIAVYLRNSARDQFGLDSNAKDIADHAESKFGKIDVSNWKPNYKGTTSASYYNRRKEYGLNKKKK